MRDLIRDMVDNARRSGDRIGVDGARNGPRTLAAETIRLARLATSIHLAQATRHLAASAPDPDHAPSGREMAR